MTYPLTLAKRALTLWLMCFAMSAYAQETALQQAIDCYHDQDVERAILTYLQALDNAVPRPCTVDQTARYADALAAAENGQLDTFFTQFYDCYCADREHYLAYKTRALLHHRLMERARESAKRDQQRQLALQATQQAIQRFSNDLSLYQMSLRLASSNEKSGLVQSALGKITRDSLVVPRHDILFYVKEAVSVHEWQLAEQFLASAQQWYPASRIVAQANQYLQERRAEIDRKG